MEAKEAMEARVKETKSSPEAPYSPSSPLNDTDEEGRMDWQSSLSGEGMKRLFRQPPDEE
jgi:hypothetical protein